MKKLAKQYEESRGRGKGSMNYDLGGCHMKDIMTVKIGDCVQFPYRKNPSLQLTGYVVSVLTNTIVVDISDMIETEKNEPLEVRQVVKHGYYNKVREKRKCNIL